MSIVGIIANPNKLDRLDIARQVISWLTANNHCVLISNLLAKQINVNVCDIYTDISELNSVSLLVAIGGDGTILFAAKLSADTGAPILGVNLGKFGFMSVIEPDDLEEGLNDYFNGKYIISEHMTLAGSFTNPNNEMQTAFALNEIVLHRQVSEPMLKAIISINGNRVADYNADGIIVSTPTGSTAYNLSAGGPIVEPTMNAIIINGICPYTLSARPFIVGSNETIEIIIKSDFGCTIVADGTEQFSMPSNGIFKIQKGEKYVKLVHSGPGAFYEKLARRIRYGSPIVE